MLVLDGAVGSWPRSRVLSEQHRGFDRAVRGTRPIPARREKTGKNSISGRSGIEPTPPSRLFFQKTRGEFPKRPIRELNRPNREPDRRNREAPGKGRHRAIPGYKIESLSVLFIDNESIRRTCRRVASPSATATRYASRFEPSPIATPRAREATALGAVAAYQLLGPPLDEEATGGNVRTAAVPSGGSTGGSVAWRSGEFYAKAPIYCLETRFSL